MKHLSKIFLLLTFISCQGQDKNTTTINEKPTLETTTELSKVEQYYNDNQGDDQLSKSTGTVSTGSLENGKLIPFKGESFQYFDTLSYLSGRAFTNDKLKKTILDTYQELSTQLPGRQFFIMECSNQHGGKIFPHRTHQNGLSIDFMMPLTKDNKDYYELDTIGKDHYWLNFDDDGKFTKDKSISIEFDLVARHILLLDEKARNNGLKITKVIIKTELKDELFATTYGQKLQASGIYIVKSLIPLINSLHDDHYHIDFEIIK